MKDLMVAMEEEGLRRIVEGSVVVVVGRRGCCMSYVAKKLLQELRANPTMCEISEGFAEKMTLMDKIAKILSGDDRTLVPPMFPLVFIRGKLVGGLDKLMTIHISGELIPMLKIAGAFWL
ncbi:putative glutaredoxin-like, plant II, Thioredoxin-like superfamily [Dioscorea sansibarensis]